MNDFCPFSHHSTERATVDMKLRVMLLFAAICAASHVTVSADEACRDGTCASNLNDLRKVLMDSEDVADYVVRMRRELHLQPELMWTETKTSALVKRELTAFGVSFEEVSSPGVVATIGSGSAPVVALRADLDALPVTEESDIPAERREPGPGQDARVRPRRPHRDAAWSRKGAQVSRGLAPRHGAPGVPARGGGRRRRSPYARRWPARDEAADRVVLRAPQLAVPRDPEWNRGDALRHNHGRQRRLR